MELSIQRLWLLIKKQWVDHQKMYWLGMLAMAGIMMLVFLLFTRPQFSNMGLEPRIQAALFLMSLVFFGAVFTSTLFNPFSEKPTGIQALMLPASSLEKTLTAILYSNILFPLVYGACIYPTLVFAHFVDVKVQGNLNELFSFNFELIWGFVIICLLVLNMALLGSIVFRRHAFIKTAILACILFFGSFYLNRELAHMVIGTTQPKTVISTTKESYSPVEVSDLTFDLLSATPFYSMGFFTSDRTFIQVKLPEQSMYMYNIFIYGLIIGLLWTATWFRLREKQV